MSRRTQGVIEISPGQRLVLCQRTHGLEQLDVEALAVPPDFTATAVGARGPAASRHNPVLCLFITTGERRAESGVHHRFTHRWEWRLVPTGVAAIPVNSRLSENNSRLSENNSRLF